MNALQTLVVDDSPSARVVLKRLLEKSGIKVHLSNSGSEAISFLQNNSPDLIFMDHTMPGMDGLETTKAITSNPKTASIPVVMYTSNNEEGYFESAKKHGAVDIVSKPASTEKIFSVLSNVLAQQQDQQAAFNTQFNAKLDRFHADIEALVERKLAESEQSIQQQLASKLTEPSHQKPREILPLIHTVTDSKIHQLNIELRNHMTAKLDVMSQDMIENSHFNNQQLLQNFNEQLSDRSQASPATSIDKFITAISPNTLINSASAMLLSSNFYLGVLIASCTFLLLN